VGAKATQVGSPLNHPFHLPRGHHLVEYRAAPFPTLKCVISVPASGRDTCPLHHATDVTDLLRTPPLVRILDLQATIDRLPTAQTIALLTAAQLALASLADAFSIGTLEVGDHFVDYLGRIQQASVESTFTAQLRLESSVTRYEGVACVTLCTATGILDPYSREDWALLAPVVLTWRYATPTGQTLMADGPTGGIDAPPILRSRMTLFLAHMDASGWQVKTLPVSLPLPYPVVCPAVDPFVEALTAITGQQAEDTEWIYAAASWDLGCLYAGTPFKATTGAPSSARVVVLYRAGAVMAANAQARHAFPTLPLASAHEHALVDSVSPAAAQ
jgi:hypothetical protein